ncbi:MULTISPECIES: hypothetical protein [Sporomusa]|uniref:hypothetical protein n=1 Tax=Sporomusa TaxID=2375 RepID=UPI00315982CA
METLNNIFKTVYQYFPRNIAYDDPQYRLSPQYARLVEKRKLCQKNELLNGQLIKLFDGYEVIIWTDLENYNDYEYRILLHRNQPILDDDIELIQALGGERLDLLLFVSILNNYFYFLVQETKVDIVTKEWSFKNVSDYMKEIELLISKLRSFLDKQGYIEVTNEMANIIIDDVETELKSKGKARVFDCLFTDLISIPHQL